MKKTLLIAFLLTLAMGTTITQAQQGYGHGSGGNGAHGNAMAGNPVDRLTEQLGLDEAQAAAIAAIFEETQLLRDTEREQFRLIACDIRANTHALVLAELTPAQIVLYEELQLRRDELRQAFEEMRQARGGSGFGGGPGMLDCDS